jgi:glycerophosphoryl diester phosphodiesterase
MQDLLFRDMRLDRPARTPVIVGHRGSPRRCAENTVASVRRALREGAVAVELDLCRTRDGRLVLWRDDRPNEHVALARQAGLVDLYAVPEVPRLGSPQRRAVGDLELAQMRETHAYHRRRGVVSEVLGLRRGGRIPFETLEDLLAAAPGLTGLQDLYLQLRLDAHLANEVFRLAARLAHFAASRNGDALSFHIMSPHQEVFAVLQEAASRRPGYILAYADIFRPGFLETARRLGARRVTCRWRGRPWNEFRADLLDILEARDRGRVERIAVWTINDPARLEELLCLGPDAILTDDVPLALRLSSPAIRQVDEREAASLVHDTEGALTVG